MSVALHVHRVHKVDYAGALVCCSHDCDSFMARLNRYLRRIEQDKAKRIYQADGDDLAEYEVSLEAVAELNKQSAEWFDTPQDKFLIGQMLEQADKDNDYIYISRY